MPPMVPTNPFDFSESGLDDETQQKFLTKYAELEESGDLVAGNPRYVKLQKVARQFKVKILKSPAGTMDTFMRNARDMSDVPAPPPVTPVDKAYWSVMEPALRGAARGMELQRERFPQSMQGTDMGGYPEYSNPERIRSYLAEMAGRGDVGAFATGAQEATGTAFGSGLGVAATAAAPWPWKLAAGIGGGLLGNVGFDAWRDLALGGEEAAAHDLVVQRAQQNPVPYGMGQVATMGTGLGWQKPTSLPSYLGQGAAGAGIYAGGEALQGRPINPGVAATEFLAGPFVGTGVRTPEPQFRGLTLPETPAPITPEVITPDQWPKGGIPPQYMGTPSVTDPSMMKGPVTFAGPQQLGPVTPGPITPPAQPSPLPLPAPPGTVLGNPPGPPMQPTGGLFDVPPIGQRSLYFPEYGWGRTIQPSVPPQPGPMADRFGPIQTTPGELMQRPYEGVATPGPMPPVPPTTTPVQGVPVPGGIERPVPGAVTNPQPPPGFVPGTGVGESTARPRGAVPPTPGAVERVPQSVPRGTEQTGTMKIDPNKKETNEFLRSIGGLRSMKDYEQEVADYSKELAQQYARPQGARDQKRVAELTQSRAKEIVRLSKIANEYMEDMDAVGFDRTLNGIEAARRALRGAPTTGDEAIKALEGLRDAYAATGMPRNLASLLARTERQDFIDTNRRDALLPSMLGGLQSLWEKSQAGGDAYWNAVRSGKIPVQGPKVPFTKTEKVSQFFRSLTGNKWLPTDLFRLPLSIKSETGETLQVGSWERVLGERGARLSQLATEADNNMYARTQSAQKTLDGIDEWMKVQYAGGGELTGDNKRRAYAELVKYIEMKKTDPDRIGAPPAIKKALDLHDGLTEEFRKSLIAYRRDVLGKPTPDDWGITDTGYFRHLFLDDFKIKYTDGSGAVQEKYARTYMDALYEAEQLEARGITNYELTAKDSAAYDPTQRLSRDRYLALANNLSKSTADPATGRRVLSVDEVREDMRGIIGEEAKKQKPINSMLFRTGAEGFEADEYRYVMNRYTNEVIQGQEITKLRRQAIPILEEAEREGGFGQKIMGMQVRAQINRMAGKPDIIDETLANLVGYLPNPIAKGAPLAVTADPARAVRNTLEGMRNVTAHVALLSRPAAALVNRSQSMTTLLPRIGAEAYKAAFDSYRTPDMQNLLRQHGILDSTVKLRANAAGELEPVLVPKQRTKSMNTGDLVGAALATPSREFSDASAYNRGIGFTYGYNLAKKNIPGCTEEQAVREGKNWMALTEFRITNATMPAIMQGDVMKNLTQFAGYPINNLEQWYDLVAQVVKPRNLSRKDATIALGKKTAIQGALGGANSLPIIGTLIGSGTYLYALEFQKRMGVEQKEAERNARILSYGAPSYLGTATGTGLDVDLSNTLAVTPDISKPAQNPFVATAQQLGPGASIAARTIQGAIRAKEKGHAYPLMNANPLLKQGYAVYSLVTGEPILFATQNEKPGGLKDVSDQWLTLMGATPFKRTIQHVEAEYRRNRKGKGMAPLPKRKAAPIAFPGTMDDVPPEG